MLQALRKSVGSWFAYVLFALLILSFGVWGIGDIFRSQPQGGPVAQVGPVKIEAPAVDAAFRQEIDRLRPLLGGQIDTQQAIALGLLDRTVNRMVDRTAMELAARDTGLRVGEEALRGEILNEAAFKNEAGQFDRDRFFAVLQQNGLNEAAYADLLRRDMMQAQIYGAVGNGAVVPQPLVEGLAGYREERRTGEAVLVAAAAVGDVGTPDQAALEAFHKERPDRYSAPEFRKLTVGTLALADIANGIQLSDEEVRQAYESRRDEFRIDERRTIEQALVADQAAAAKIAEAAKDSADLGAAAQKAGVADATVSTLDGVTKAGLLPELADKAFALGAGAVSEPVQSALGWHVMRAVSVTPPTERGFDEVKAEIAQGLRNDRAADRLYELSNKAQDEVAGGGRLEDVAGSLNLQVKTVEAVDAQGLTPQGEAAGQPFGPEVLARAFQMRAGEDAQAVDLPSGDVALIRVDSVTEPALKPLDTVRDQVVADWQADQRARKATEKAEALAKAANDGKPWAEVVAEAGAAPAPLGPVTRDGRGEGGPARGLSGVLFGLQPGKAGTLQEADGTYVVRLAEVQPAADPADAKSRIGTALKGEVSNDLVAQFNAALRRRYDVSIDQQALAQLYRPTE